MFEMFLKLREIFHDEPCSVLSFFFPTDLSMIRNSNINSRTSQGPRHEFPLRLCSLTKPLGIPYSRNAQTCFQENFHAHVEMKRSLRSLNVIIVVYYYFRRNGNR